MRKWLIVVIGVHALIFLLADEIIASAIMLAVLYHHAFRGVE